ncbi:MAG: hypothetical protein H7288_16245 [Kineosporiaceae bacterium]|nr:hypothetical protein [Aeromicrobium sp.]
MAWAERTRTGNESEELLARSFQDVGASPPDETAFELFLTFWRREVPPAKLAKELKRAQRSALWGLLRVLIPKAGSPGVDKRPGWMTEPRGVNLTSWDHWDAPIHKLDFRLASGSEDLLVECLEAPLDEDGHHEVPVWLRPSEELNVLDVLVGKFCLGSTNAATGDWEIAKTAAEADYYADGHLWIDSSRGDIEVVSLQVQFPVRP